MMRRDEQMLKESSPAVHHMERFTEKRLSNRETCWGRGNPQNENHISTVYCQFCPYASVSNCNKSKPLFSLVDIKAREQASAHCHSCYNNPYDHDYNAIYSVCWGERSIGADNRNQLLWDARNIHSIALSHTLDFRQSPRVVILEFSPFERTDIGQVVALQGLLHIYF